MTPVDETELEGSRMPLMEHLFELRNRLIKMVLAVAIGALLGWIFYETILEFLKAPYQTNCDAKLASAIEAGEEFYDANPACQLLVTDPLESFRVRMTVAGYSGLALAMPVILWQLWGFISPGLYKRERRYGMLFVVSGVLLFTLGAGLAYWSLPRALEFLDNIGGQDLVTFFSPDKYLSFVVKMMLAFGLGFEFPILLIFLQIAGLLTNQQLRDWRRYAVVGIVVMTAVITPSGDPFTLMVLTVPMYIFYEVAIIFGRLRARRVRAAETGA